MVSGGRLERRALVHLVDQRQHDGDVEQDVDRVPGLVRQPAPGEPDGQAGRDDDDAGGAHAEQRAALPARFVNSVSTGGSSKLA